jgi:hypothetical protein
MAGRDADAKETIMAAAPGIPAVRPSSVPRRPPASSVPSQLLFRELNEQIAARLRDSAGEEDVQFVCECERRHCDRPVQLSLARYEQIRQFPTRFLTRPGHWRAEEDRVVAEEAGYVIVEKTGPTAQLAIRLDPRRPTHVAGNAV